MEIIFPAVLIVAAAVAVYAVLAFNRLVKARQRVGEAWSGMDVQLRRRADLVPNLVETVEGHVTHERGMIETVTAARSVAAAVPSDNVSERAASEQTLGAALGRVMAVAEDTPELRSDGSFHRLQENLSKIEHDLQHARRYFNATVRDLNTRVESFPAILFASQFGFEQIDYFEIEDPADRSVPQIEFDGGER